MFAGSGGLSDGFAAVTYKGKPIFEVVLSLEKEKQAHSTQRLRSFFRQYGDSVPDDYYWLLRGEIDKESLFEVYPTIKYISRTMWLLKEK